MNNSSMPKYFVLALLIIFIIPLDFAEANDKYYIRISSQAERTTCFAAAELKNMWRK